MTRASMIETLHTDLDAAGKALAERLHAAISQELTGSFEQAAVTFEATEEDHDLVLPGLAYQTTRHLSSILADAAKGWEQVFWTNLAERYEETGEA